MYSPEDVSFEGNEARIVTEASRAQEVVDRLKEWITNTNNKYRELVQHYKEREERANRQRIEAEIQAARVAAQTTKALKV
jgi:hypothetical protein